MVKFLQLVKFLQMVKFLQGGDKYTKVQASPPLDS